VKQHILIVEDNPLNSELLRDWLEVEGYQALIAPNLNTAWGLVKTRQPTAVLLDVQLGTDDGLSLVRWMRQRPEIRHIPVIAVTAQVMATDQCHILESGCNAVVSKPIDFKVLQEQLQFWIDRATAFRQTPLPGKI
jgi:two-component system cell cycle response regulator DivK